MCVARKNPITKKWYINYDRAIEWTDGRLVKLQIATDITEYKKMEQQLQQIQRFEAIGTLAGGIAHDFNNLLMGIQGRNALMDLDIGPSHAHAEHIKAISDYIRSASNLTGQLLGLARGGKYEVKPIDMNALVQNSATMFGRTKKEIRIHMDFCSPPLVVAVDKSQIEQVLLNVYVNAWHAMPNGGDLYLKTQIVDLGEFYINAYSANPGRYAVTSITDTGVGMDLNTQQQIFDPFFTTKEKGRGTGLGLASAYGIINNHDGIITVDSEVGHGTTFNIYLPLSDKSLQDELSKGEELRRGKENLLLVDDETMILEVGQAMLEKLGYHVLIANSGQMALDTIQIKGNEIDLVILDLIMPGMEGGKVFDCIKEIFPHMPMMLSSGYSINSQAEQIMEKGCNGFIQKPFSISELSKKVRKILDEAKKY
jgi:two-component system cell cycle sensor histidine kinase/response regulator CckA